MKIIKGVGMVMLHTFALLIYLWTFFHYMVITSDIPISYTVAEWNLHVQNLRISGITIVIQVLLIYLAYKSKSRAVSK